MSTEPFANLSPSDKFTASAPLPPPARTQPARAGDDLGRLLAQFAPIGLAQMDAVALLDRTDTKYVMGAGQLYAALEALSDDYRVLEIGGVRVHPYRTLYFDTADFALYMRHHAGRQRRFKVRSREYVHSRRSFLEVKVKTRGDRTSKQRLETVDLVTHWTPETSGFVAAHAPLAADALEPKLWNSFMRVTLVGQHEPERLTLDLGLRFDDGRDSICLPGVTIAEVKQDGINRGSLFVRKMRAMAIQPTGFSKYCIGAAMLHPEIKHNNFKDKLRLVDRLTGDPNHVYGPH